VGQVEGEGDDVEKGSAAMSEPMSQQEREAVERALKSGMRSHALCEFGECDTATLAGAARRYLALTAPGGAALRDRLHAAGQHNVNCAVWESDHHDKGCDCGLTALAAGAGAGEEVNS
jgi:hypothetical protein